MTRALVVMAQIPTTNTQLVVPLPPMFRVANVRAPGT